MNSQSSKRSDLFDELLEQASLVAQETLARPGSAARLRRLDGDAMNEIERLEESALALDQFAAVAYRLAGSRALRDDISNNLRMHFESTSSSLEIEAQRRGIWKLNRSEPLPLTRAEAATDEIERFLASQNLEMAIHLPRWAALYADLWCDPRIGATVEAAGSCS